MKTKAAVLSAINRPLTIEELDVPELADGQVLVRVLFAGVCHQQLHEIRGLKGPDTFLPHTLGHEGAGLVEQVGKLVTKVRPGDHVALTWIKSDGIEVPSCVYHRQSGADVHSGPISTFLQAAVISENRLVKIANEMPMPAAALLGCAYATGAGVILNTAKVKPGDSVVVFGAGGIGLSAIMAASAAGAAPVYAVDVSSDKLSTAIKLGASAGINASETDPVEAIMQRTARRGADFAIEAAGRKESMEWAFRSVKERGGLCIIVGNLAMGEKISLDPLDLIRGRRIVGSAGGECRPDLDIPKFVNGQLSGVLQLEDLISKIYPLREINAAFSDLEQGKVARALISMAGE